jgi:hypothetical protein
MNTANDEKQIPYAWGTYANGEKHLGGLIVLTRCRITGLKCPYPHCCTCAVPVRDAMMILARGQ